VPPFTILHDTTLEDLAASRPTTMEELSRVKGIAAKKAEQFGERLLAALAEAVRGERFSSGTTKRSAGSHIAEGHFAANGTSVEQVMEVMGRAREHGVRLPRGVCAGGRAPRLSRRGWMMRRMRRS
jgi:ribonuclease D